MQRLVERKEDAVGAWAVEEMTAEVYLWFLCWMDSLLGAAASKRKLEAYESPVFQIVVSRSCPGEEIFSLLLLTLSQVA